jgi:hypothetical protein
MRQPRRDRDEDIDVRKRVTADETVSANEFEGRFVAAWRDRVACADGYDIVMIVELDVKTCEG